MEGEKQGETGSSGDSQDWISTAPEDEEAQLMLMSQFGDLTTPTELGPDLDCIYRPAQRCHIIRQVHRNLMVYPGTILIAPPGHGKSSAILHLTQWQLDVPETTIDVMNTNNFRACNCCQDKDDVDLNDDFLADISLGYSINCETVDGLQDYNTTLDKRKRYIVTSMSSILEEGLSMTGADLALITGKCKVVDLSIDKEGMFTDLLGEQRDDIEKPPSDVSPSIGFALCCKLAPHLTSSREIFFQRPRHALRLALKNLMTKSEEARLALSILAVEYEIKMYNFLNGDRFPDCPSLKNLIKLRDPLHPVTPRQIAQCYLKLDGLVKVDKNVILFASKAIREEVLLLLCDSHINFVTTSCSLQTITEIALASCDEAKQAQAPDMPVLKKSATSAFLKRILKDMDNRNYRETLTLAIFQHQSFREKFEETMRENHALVENWVKELDQNNLHFLFWAGACDLVFNKALTYLKKDDTWVVCQALVGSCYWGKEKATAYLLQLLQEKLPVKKLLQEASLQDIVEGKLAELGPRDAPDWQLVPFSREDTLLTLAAWRGHDAVVQLLVSKEWPVDYPGMDERTALMHYCASANEEMAQFLLSQNANPLAVDEYGMTPLLYCVYRREWNLPSPLLSEEGVRASNRMSETPLTVACASGWSVPTIQKMISKGADPLVSDKWGNSCLHYACFNGQVDLVELLLDRYGLQVDAKNIYQHTPLMLAGTRPQRAHLIDVLLNYCLESHRRMVKKTELTALEETRLCQILGTASSFSDGVTLSKSFAKVELNEKIRNICWKHAFMYGNTEAIDLFWKIFKGPKYAHPISCKEYVEDVCHSGSLECARRLFSMAPSLERFRIGAAILLSALKHGQLHIVKYFIKYQKEMAPCRDYEFLFHAVLSNLPLLVSFCLNQPGVNIDCVDKDENTPLLWALKNGKSYSARYLLCRGADPTKADVHGLTCLHLAASSGIGDIVEYLLRSTNAQTLKDTSCNAGMTPLMYACRGGHVDIVELLGYDEESLKKTNEKGAHCLELAVRSGNIDLVSMCLPHFDGRVETRCSERNTPLHLACEEGNADMAWWLQSEGADPEAVNEAGETPLMLAFEGGHVDFLDVLGLDEESLKKTNAKGAHCLELAVRSGSTDLVMECLPYFPEGIDTRCSENKTPLHVAIENRNPFMVSWLLERGADRDAVNGAGEKPRDVLERMDRSRKAHP